MRRIARRTRANLSIDANQFGEMIARGRRACQTGREDGWTGRGHTARRMARAVIELTRCQPMCAGNSIANAKLSSGTTQRWPASEGAVNRSIGSSQRQSGLRADLGQINFTSLCAANSGAAFAIGNWRWTVAVAITRAPSAWHCWSGGSVPNGI